MKLYRNILWCFICVIACILFLATKSSSAQIEVVKASEKRIEMLEVENACLKQQIEQQREFIIELQDEIEGLRADVTELKVVEEEAEPVVFEETEIEISNSKQENDPLPPSTPLLSTQETNEPEKQIASTKKEKHHKKTHEHKHKHEHDHKKKKGDKKKKDKKEDK